MEEEDWDRRTGTGRHSYRTDRMAGVGGFAGRNRPGRDRRQDGDGLTDRQIGLGTLFVVNRWRRGDIPSSSPPPLPAPHASLPTFLPQHTCPHSLCLPTLSC